jgi:hypothetical protein
MKKILFITLISIACTSESFAQTTQYLYRHSKNIKPDTVSIEYVKSGLMRMKYLGDNNWLTKTENDSVCTVDIPGTTVVINKKSFIAKPIYHNDLGIEYIFPMSIGELSGTYKITFLGYENKMRKYLEKTFVLNTDGSTLYNDEVITTFSSAEYIYSQHGNGSDGYFSMTLIK